jgi:hypothetical protein
MAMVDLDSYFIATRCFWRVLWNEEALNIIKTFYENNFLASHSFASLDLVGSMAQNVGSIRILSNRCGGVRIMSRFIHRHHDANETARKPLEHYLSSQLTKRAC